MNLLITNTDFHKTLIDALESCGLLVDYCDAFMSCLDSHSDGTHSLQRIHWWESDMMLNFSKSVPMKKQTHQHLGWPQVSANFHFGWTIPLIHSTGQAICLYSSMNFNWMSFWHWFKKYASVSTTHWTWVCLMHCSQTLLLVKATTSWVICADEVMNLFICVSAYRQRMPEAAGADGTSLTSTQNRTTSRQNKNIQTVFLCPCSRKPSLACSHPHI